MDLHKGTAAHLFKIPVEQVTKQQRNIAKTINFGLNYGMWAPGLKTDLKTKVGIDVTVQEAEAFIRDFQKLYPGVTQYLKIVSNEGLKNLEIRNKAGRLIKFNNPADDKARSQIKRESKNKPIQSLCADMVKIAMSNIFLQLEPKGVKFINTVHDELVFECTEDQAEEVKDIVKTEMEKAGALFLTDLPCVADVKINDMWIKD